MSTVDLVYGADDLDSENPPWLPQGFAGRALRRSGGPLRVRTIAHGAKRRVPYLCAGDRRLATLPALYPGRRIVEVTINGDALAWRTASTNRRGFVSVGRITKGTVRRVRTNRVTGGRLLRQDGRLTVAPNGDAAWALESGSGRRYRARLWAWPRGGRVQRLRLDRNEEGFISSILLVDDQHVFVDGRAGAVIAKPYRRPTRGRCPSLIGEAWLSLGAWRVASVAGFAGTTDGSSSLAWTIVCDPVSGRLLHVEPEVSAYDHYCIESDETPRAASVGPWLVLERRSTAQGGYCGGPFVTYKASVINTVTGDVVQVAGGLSGPGAAVRRPMPSDESTTGAWAAVIVRDGAIAWVSEGEVHLADALGARVVGGGSGAGLVLDDQLRWIDGDTPQSVAVTPHPQWRAATATFE